MDGDDFVECYRVHYPRLVRAIVLAGASRPEAEDVAQEAFARMLVRWRRVRAGTNPAGYAYRTAFRLLRRSRRPSGDQHAPPDRSGPARRSPVLRGALPGPAPEDLVTTRLTVAAALAAMPPRRRNSAVLCLVVGLSTSEVATALGIAEGTVRKHIEAARADLRSVL